MKQKRGALKQRTDDKFTRIAWSVLYHGCGFEPRMRAELA